MIRAVDTQAIVRFRHALHADPELSGAEVRTHDAIHAELTHAAPAARLFENLGGTGLAAVFGPESAKRTVVFRVDTDALAITERSGAVHASRNHGVMHACGHDGHTAIGVAVAARVAADPPADARVVVVFQPAEETGEGAAAVLADPRWASVVPDPASTIGFALHNMPGEPLGRVLVRAGTFACASVGVRAVLVGRSAHASAANDPGSAMAALGRLIDRSPGLPDGLGLAGARCTPVHAAAGDAGGFGISPAEARFACTLRAQSDTDLARLRAAFGDLMEEAGAGLAVTLTEHEGFPAMVNDARAVEIVRRAAAGAGFTIGENAAPYRWSEDFARFAAAFPCAMFTIGAGEGVPALHDDRYDFPDALIEPAAGLVERLLRLAAEPA
jgi:amidohydrolase